MRLVATSIVALEVFFLKLKLSTLTGRAGGFCHAEATIKKTASLQSHLEATPGFEPGIEVLQTFALPLGYVAILRRDS